jgi:NADH dehydrogenase FAD-containing subunit
VVGGGFAGAYVAKSLESQFSVTLIDCKDYFEFTPSVLRTIVEPNHVDKIQIRHRQYLNLKKSQVVFNRVNSIQEDHVVTDEGEVGFDYLVLCTGSTYNKPFKEANVILSNRGHTLSSYYHQLHQTQTVLIIGGGIVGVELAAEIVEHFPGKEVIIIHSGPHLMSSRSPVPDAAVRYTERFFAKHSIRVILNERVVEFAPKGKNVFKTNQGTSIQADLAFLCTGITPNSKYLRKGPFASHLDERGYLRVNRHLHLHDHPHIFVAGDLAAIDEEKLAQSAERQAEVVIKNIVRQEFTAKENGLCVYKSVDRPMLISLGKYDGLLIYKGWTLSGFIPALMKEFVEWKVMVAYKYRASHVWESW